jgi:hypothetical protein
VQEAFASWENARFHKFWTREDNAFAKTWTRERIWANPPWTLMNQVILKIIADQVQEMVLIAPEWRTTTWWPVLQKMTVKFIIFEEGTRFFEIWDQQAGQMQPTGPLRWPVRACLVQYRRFQEETLKDMPPGDEGATSRARRRSGDERGLSEASKRRYRRQRYQWFAETWE